MRWEECVGSYRAIVSLGSTCQTAYQLNRLGLRRTSGPIDWFVTRSVPGLLQLLARRFEGLMDFPHLQVVGLTGEALTVRDSRYDIVSFHDFPLGPPPFVLRDAYPALRAQVDRRVQRFLRTLQLRPVLLVRTDTSPADAHQLHAAVSRLASASPRLLIVNTHTDGNPGPVQEDWRLDGICGVRVPPGTDWRGNDAAWAAVMRGFSVSP